MCSPWTWGSGLLTCFAAGLCLRLTLSYNLTQHSTSTPLPKPERHGFTGLLPVSGRWSVSPSAFWGRPEFEPGFLPVWWAVFTSPHLFLCLTGFCCASKTTPTCQEDESPSGSSCLLVPRGVSSQRSGDMHPGNKGGDNSPCLHNPGKRATKKCCRKLLAEVRDTEGI
jgi:hypothetical protein